MATCVVLLKATAASKGVLVSSFHPEHAGRLYSPSSEMEDAWKPGERPVCEGYWWRRTIRTMGHSSNAEAGCLRPSLKESSSYLRTRMSDARRREQNEQAYVRGEAR